MLVLKTSLVCMCVGALNFACLYVCWCFKLRLFVCVFVLKTSLVCMCVGALNFACLYVCWCFKFACLYVCWYFKLRVGALQKMFSHVGMFPGFNQ